MPIKKTRKQSTKTADKGEKGGLSTVAVSAAGAVVGAALGGAAAAALTNEKTRKTLGAVAERVGEYTTDAVGTVNENASEIVNIPEDTIIEAGDKAKNKLRK